MASSMALTDISRPDSKKCRQHFKALYDKIHFILCLSRTAICRSVNPLLIEKLFDERPSYEYVRYLAFQRLHQTFQQQLNFIMLKNQCETYDLQQMRELFYNVFSWSAGDFLTRLKLKNCTWLEVLTMNATPECLEQLKLHQDLNELKGLVNLFFRVLRDMAYGKVDLDRRIWLPLRDVRSYSNLPSWVQKYAKVLRKEFEALKKRLITEDVGLRLELQHKQVAALEDVVMNSDVWDPIEVRYHVNWLRSIVNQNQYSTDIIHFNIERDISKFMSDATKERICDGSVLNCYYTEVEQYKNRITNLQERFDQEYDSLDNDINYIQLQIDKLRDQKNFLRKEIKRFHEEIERRLQKEERWRLEAEQKQLAKEAALLAHQEELKRKLKEGKKGSRPGTPAKK